MIKHAPHLLAAPFVAATTWHTAPGIGFEPAALSWAVAAGLAAGVWVGWSHVFGQDRPGWVRGAALAATLALTPIEAYLMYQYKGDVPAPSYVAEMAKYEQAVTDHKQALANWQQQQANLDLQRDAIKAQIQEIIDTDKLTTRRADMTRLQADLANLDNSAPPQLEANKPEEKAVTNQPWLIKSLVAVGVVPVIYALIHLFGFVRREDKQPAQPANATVQAVATVTETVTEAVTAPKPATVAATIAPLDTSKSDTGIFNAISKIAELPKGAEFDCPVCGAAVTKKRKDTKHCGSSACKTRISRAMAACSNVINLSSRKTAKEGQ